MPREIDEIDWDNSETPHIFEHRIEEEDIHQFVFTSDWAPIIDEGPGNLDYVYGQTEPGRYVFAVGEVDEEAKVRFISVRDMNKTEKRWYRENRRRRYEITATGPGEYPDSIFLDDPQPTGLS